MARLSRFIKYAGYPILFGIIAALGMILAMPSAQNPLQGAFSPKKLTHQNRTSYAEAVQKASASVVNIYTLKARTNQFDPLGNPYPASASSQLQTGTGSGVIVSSEGYIITTLHVIEPAQQFRVALQDGREAEPELIGFSKAFDMAILKIDLENLQAIEIGDPDQAQVGDVVLAIGNPLGIGQTVTQGIISGTRRKGLKIAAIENFIQTDAAINPGNSGGALVDTQGRLLGINIADLRKTLYGDASGIGFAIPVDRAIKALNDIVKHGRVVRGWLGLSAMDISPQYMRIHKLTVDSGIIITKVQKNGPADIAGLDTGDIITAINNQAIHQLETAIQELGALSPGDTVTFEVIRNGETRQLEAVLSSEPSR